MMPRGSDIPQRARHQPAQRFSCNGLKSRYLSFSQGYLGQKGSGRHYAARWPNCGLLVDETAGHRKPAGVPYREWLVRDFSYLGAHHVFQGFDQGMLAL